MGDTRAENSNFDEEIDALRDLPVTENDPRFASEEMITCGTCSRSSPPNRTSCLYCGNQFDANSVRTDIAKISYQTPEAWEDGFSLVYAGKRGLSSDVTGPATELLQVEPGSLDEILNIDIPIPLIYLRSLPDASLLASRLAEIGFDCAVIGDDLLQAKVLPTRIRSIMFDSDAALFVDFNTSSVTPVRFDETTLFVFGSLIKTSTELSGKLSKRALKATDESHAFSDEAVIDIYPPSDVYGFRIRSSGFDFSCLGARMSRFAGTNITELTSEFRARFASGVFIDAFQSAAPLVTKSWPPDEIKQSNSTRGPLGGVQRQTVTVSDNTDQFTKFSRLQRHFI
jgi:hypothetical protein